MRSRGTGQWKSPNTKLQPEKKARANLHPGAFPHSPSGNWTARCVYADLWRRSQLSHLLHYVRLLKEPFCEAGFLNWTSLHLQKKPVKTVLNTAFRPAFGEYELFVQIHSQAQQKFTFVFRYGNIISLIEIWQPAKNRLRFSSKTFRPELRKTQPGCKRWKNHRDALFLRLECRKVLACVPLALDRNAITYS